MGKILSLFFFSLLVAINSNASADARVESLPFEFIDNRLFVSIFINDEGPFKFLFDTGGANTMTPATAKKLKLSLQPAGEARGAGEGAIPMQKTKVTDLKIGSIHLRQQNFMVMDLAPIQKAFNFKEFDGVFGYEVLQEYVTGIDFEKKTISFARQSTPLVSNDSQKIPFEIVDDNPVIKAQINGLSARVLIDTGDRSALSVFQNMQKHRIVGDAFKDSPVKITGYSIGGPISAKLGRIKSLKLNGKVVMGDVLARLPTTKGGFNSMTKLNASIGNEVLRQFNIIFDYGNKIAYFSPNRHFGEPTTFTDVPNP